MRIVSYVCYNETPYASIARTLLFGDTMVPNSTPIMENQMEKKMENEMETGII